MNCAPCHSTAKHRKMNTFIPDKTLRCIDCRIYILFSKVYANIRIKMKICIKSSFYISRVFKPSIDTDLPTITPRPADTAPVNRYQHSQSQLAIHAANWPCNSGHAISRLLHCGLCEHNFSGPVSFTNTTRALSREPCKRLVLAGHTYGGTQGS